MLLVTYSAKLEQKIEVWTIPIDGIWASRKTARNDLSDKKYYLQQKTQSGTDHINTSYSVTLGYGGFKYLLWLTILVAANT